MIGRLRAWRRRRRLTRLRRRAAELYNGQPRALRRRYDRQMGRKRSPAKAGRRAPWRKGAD